MKGYPAHGEVEWQSAVAVQAGGDRCQETRECCVEPLVKRLGGSAGSALQAPPARPALQKYEVPRSPNHTPPGGRRAREGKQRVESRECTAEGFRPAATARLPAAVSASLAGWCERKAYADTAVRQGSGMVAGMFGRGWPALASRPPACAAVRDGPRKPLYELQNLQTGASVKSRVVQLRKETAAARHAS